MSHAEEALGRISCSALGVSGALALALACTPQIAVAQEQPEAPAGEQTAAAAPAPAEGTEAPAEEEAAPADDATAVKAAPAAQEPQSAEKEAVTGAAAEGSQAAAATSVVSTDAAASAPAEPESEAAADGAAASAASADEEAPAVPAAAEAADTGTAASADADASYTVEILGTTSGKLDSEAGYGIPLAAGVKRSDDPDAYVMDFTGYTFEWTDVLDGKSLDIWGQANNIAYVNPISGSVVTVTMTAPDGTVQTASVTLGYEKADAEDVRYYRWSDGSVDLRCQDGVSAPWNVDVSYDGGRSWQTLTCYGFSLSLPADKVKTGLVKARYPENDYYLEGPITSIVNLGSPAKGDSFTVSSVWADGATGDEAVADISFTVDLNYSVNPPTDYDRTVTQVTAANGTVWTCTPVGYRKWVYTASANLAAANGWRATIQIPDELGDEAYAVPGDFTVKEQGSAYTLIMSGSIADGIVLTHTPSEETIDIPVAATMPEGSTASIKAVLTRNGESVAIAELSAKAGWSGSFAGQLRFAPDGTRYEYGVYALDAEGFDVTASGTADEGFSLAFAPKAAEAAQGLPVPAGSDSGQKGAPSGPAAGAVPMKAAAAGAAEAGRKASALPETGDAAGIASAAGLAASGLAALAGAFSLRRRSAR